MWFKKKSVLQAEGHYNTEKSANGTIDLRTTYGGYNNSNYSINNSGLPSAADAGNYFYLPALGSYSDRGQLNEVGRSGSYWSSSAHPTSNNSAYYLYIYGGTAGVGAQGLRFYGFRAEALQ